MSVPEEVDAGDDEPGEAVRVVEVGEQQKAGADVMITIFCDF
jgi:hypothetical protein